MARRRIRGELVEVVRVQHRRPVRPARAEIVIEGHSRRACGQLEGPFGEYAGYMGTGGHHLLSTSPHHLPPQPIYQAFMSQMPPSESSCIKQIGRESMTLYHLRDTLGLPIKDVLCRRAPAPFCCDLDGRRTRATR